MADPDWDRLAAAYHPEPYDDGSDPPYVYVLSERDGPIWGVYREKRDAEKAQKALGEHHDTDIEEMEVE